MHKITTSHCETVMAGVLRRRLPESSEFRLFFLRAPITTRKLELLMIKAQWFRRRPPPG